MAFWFLLGGALLSLAGMVFHGAIGGRIYLENIQKSDMTELMKSLSLVSWHVFTIFLFVSAVALTAIAFDPAWRAAAYPVIGVNLLGAALFVGLGLGRHRQLLRMPGAYLMGGTVLLAGLGIG